MISEEFGERVRDVLLKHGRDGKPASLRSAEIRTGIPHSTIQNMAAGVVPRDPDKIRLFADKYSKPRTPFLVAGFHLPTEEDREWDAEQYGENDTKQADKRKEGEEETEPMPTLRDSLLRFGSLVDTSKTRVLSTVPCGSMGDREETDGVPIDDLVLQDYTLTVEGRSMEPLFYEGDILFIQQLRDGEPRLREPNIIYLKDWQEPTCAYVDVAEWGKYVLYKRNGEYEEQVVNAEDCDFQGYVMGFIQKPPQMERERLRELEGEEAS